MRNKKQQGVVSIFIVIFTSLLLTVLVVGFLRLMIQEQKQATNQDLSQSAYDSAMSGVEDAKRVLRACSQGVTDACDAINTAPKQCNTVSAAGIVSAAAADSSETIINSDGTTANMNQGYTCVLIERQTDDFVGNIVEGDSEIVPLKAIGADGIRKITIEWMRKTTAGTSYEGGGATSISQPTPSIEPLLPPLGDWHDNAPSLLRVQAVLPASAGSVTADELDTNIVSTTFLRPTSIADEVNTDVPLPGLRATNGVDNVPTAPVPIKCSNTTYTGGGYACSVALTLPASYNGGGPVPLGSTVAFLRLTSLYRGTSYRITMEGNSGPLKFDGVQPTVDSTGRADNVYRRVSSRLKMSSSITPPAAINITGSLCKNFYVTDTTAATISTCKTDPDPELEP